MDRYPVPANTQRFELEVKRSRFITTVAATRDKPDAKQIIDSVRKEYPDANHHCWAMVAGTPDDIYQHDQSDDGEPKGTAGKPILNVLQHSGLGNTVVIVTRYFGGIKLGSGGLVRAYTQATTDGLSNLQTRLMFVRKKMQIVLPYTAFDAFEHWLKNTNTIVADKTFTDSIVLSVEVPESEKKQLEQRVEIAGGTVIA